MRYGKFELNEREVEAIKSIKVIMNSHGLNVSETATVLSVLQSSCDRRLQKRRAVKA